MHCPGGQLPERQKHDDDEPVDGVEHDEVSVDEAMGDTVREPAYRINQLQSHIRFVFSEAEAAC
jgi:hypothetical protein